MELIDVTAENAGDFPCCGISNPDHPGRVAKLAWMKKQFRLGLRAKILTDSDGKPCAYIEYIPGEHAWRGVDARGYMFIHCIWNNAKREQRKGQGAAMLEACAKDAKESGMNGVAAIARDGPWMADSRLFLANGFQEVDTAPPDYRLLALKFREKAEGPSFRRGWDEKLSKYGKGLTILRSAQCPYIEKFTAEIAEAAQSGYAIKPRIVKLRTCREAQNAPTPYAVFSVIHNGRVLADHQISRTRFRNIMNKMFRGSPAAGSRKAR